MTKARPGQTRSQRGIADSGPTPQTGFQEALPLLRDRLVRLSYRFLWNHEDAEDVAHDSLVTALARIDDLRDSSKWWSWVCRVAVNRCFVVLRRRAKGQQHEQALQFQSRGEAGDRNFVGSDGGDGMASHVDRQTTAAPKRGRRASTHTRHDLRADCRCAGHSHEHRTRACPGGARNTPET